MTPADVLQFMGCDDYSHTALGNVDSFLHRLALVPENGSGIIGLTLQLASVSIEVKNVGTHVLTLAGWRNRGSWSDTEPKTG